MTAVAAPPVVRAVGIVKNFRRDAEVVHALRGVDLLVPHGSIVGIAGVSGSGKSTLLGVLCGWEKADAGVVEFDGASVSMRELPWSDLALVPQSLGLLDELPALENVLLPARLAGVEHEYRERAVELLDRLGAAHLAGRFVDQVSLGEQQRIAIARALLLRPRLLLADEPTAHQDHGWGDVVLELLRQQVRDGGASVLVSHHRQALAHADVLLTMVDGVLT